MSKLHVITKGDPKAPALLLVHALGTDHRFWEEPTADLSRDFFCIMPDLQAAGQTPNPPQPVTAEEHAEDLAGVLRELGIGRTVIAGCAIGGMVAALTAVAHPDLAAAVIMTNPGVGNAPAVREMLRARVAEVRAHGMQVLLPSAPERSFQGMPRDARFDLYVERYVAQDPEAYALSVLGFLDIDLRPALPRLACPLLLIPGGNDVLMPADGAAIVAGLVPHAQTVRFDDIAHFVPFQAPDRFAAEARRFIAENAVW